MPLPNLYLLLPLRRFRPSNAIEYNGWYIGDIGLYPIISIFGNGSLVNPLNMAENVENAETKEASKFISASYPSETIDSCLRTIRPLVEAHGGGSTVSRQEIAIILGKSENTLILKMSSCVQYGLLDKNHGKGYGSSKLYDSIVNPEYDHSKQQALVEAFKNPPLYSKLIDRYNGKPLPTESGLRNILVSEYKINKNSAERAAKVFFDNCQSIGVVDNGNRLRVLSNNHNRSVVISPTDDKTAPTQEKQTIELTEEQPGKYTNIFSAPIPLGDRIATLHYPLDITKEEFEMLDLYLKTILTGLKMKLKIPPSSKK